MGVVAMATLRIQLFGTLRLQRCGRVLDILDTRAGELFTYLLLHRERPQSRELLAATFWGDSPTSQARKYLRQALWQLQVALNGHNQPAAVQMLCVEPNWIGLNPHADLWLDIAAFERGFRVVQDVDGADLDTDMASALAQAVALYRGDLLEGWYQEWCLRERERLQIMHLAMLEKLMGYCEAHGQYERGAGYGEQILRFDRAHESAYYRLMRLHYLAGDRTMALRQYSRCVSVLETELDVAPSRRTENLYQQIRADHLEGHDGPIRGTGMGAEHSMPSLSDVIASLQQLHFTVTELKDQLQRDIRIAEYRGTLRNENSDTR
jgi:DNA-binding SARP family transcriptional activator